MCIYSRKIYFICLFVLKYKYNKDFHPGVKQPLAASLLLLLLLLKLLLLGPAAICGGIQEKQQQQQQQQQIRQSRLQW